MYTAESIKKEVKNNALYVTVKFTNGKESFEQEFWANSGTDPYWLQNRVNGRLFELNELLKLAETMPLGPVPTGYGQNPPSEAQVWAEDVLKLKNMKAAVEIGVLAEDDPKLLAQQKAVEEGFDDSYITTVRLI